MTEVKGRKRQQMARAEVLIELLSAPETALLSSKELAAKLGLKPASLRCYLKDKAILDEVARRKALRANPRLDGLEGVDLAMLKSAQEGNVSAAKLVYARMGSWETPTVADVPALLEEIEALKKKLEKVGKERKG